MELNEPQINDQIETYKISNNIGIYFLIKDNQVVYVGKTTSGIISAYKHKGKKDFDVIKFVPIKLSFLNKAQDYFIKKYKPILNNSFNYDVNYTFERTRLEVKEMLGLKYFSTPQFKKMVNKLGFKPDIDFYKHKLIFDDKTHDELLQTIYTKARENK